MKNFFLHYQSSIIAGLCFGFLFFLMSTLAPHANNTMAAITIPYENTDAGLTAEISEDAVKVITQNQDDVGAKMIANILSEIFFIMKSILGVIVIFWIVWTGVYIVAGSTDEERVKSGKQMFKYAIFGLAAMLLIEPMVLDVFYGGGQIHTDTTGIGDIQKSTDNFRTEITGIIDFVKTLLIFIGMAYIIKAGAQMIFAFGEEDKITNAKSMVIPIFFGFLLVIFNEIIINQVLYNAILDGETVKFTLGDASGVSPFVVKIVAFLKYLMGFVGVILFGFIVYGSFIIMTSLGDDDKVESGKKILINAIIGMTILLVSFMLTISLVNFDI